ncbi:MAG: hypothetical protein GKR94_01790 [Gammaproteobacteria bacterium]|nr:hypothetical protein [Gammaproteobacteria bacterium]
MTMTTHPLEPFGYRVDGLPIHQGLDDATAAHLCELWSNTGLLIFRRQSLAEQELVAFSRCFGDPDVIVREDWQSANCPEVVHITNMKDYFGNSIGGLGAGELDWHTDQSYMAAPATGSILYMVEMPNDAPRTYWANLQLAYAALSEETKKRIAELNVVYDYWLRQSRYDDEPKMPLELREKTPPVSHPLVNVHPLTGAKALYLDPTTAAGIDGWPADESKALLAELAAHAAQTQFVYRHDWQVGDVAMWDNGFLMHRRDAFEPVKNRLLKRTTLRLSPQRHIVPSGALLSAV